jgi:hypothetical protein
VKNAGKKNPEPIVLETLSDHIRRVEKMAPQLSKKGLIVSTDLKVRAFRENRGIRKTPIAWPMWDYKMFYIVDVPADTTVPRHSHGEAIFRILISGSLTVNNVLIDEPGTWYVVPAYTEYEITTTTGYKALSGYGVACETSRQQARRSLRKMTL